MGATVPPQARATALSYIYIEYLHNGKHLKSRVLILMLIQRANASGYSRNTLNPLVGSSRFVDRRKNFEKS